MSQPREVAPDRFPDLAATLFADQAVIALTPATADLAWAAGASRAAARAVARSGRRVGLVDLSLEHPALRSGAGEEGIVDAFVFGVSLGHVAHEEEPNLHVIGAGTQPPDPAEVWASERWPRLARGFRQEGALLLLFVPPAALPHLSAPLDGLVVLAPQGYRPDSPTFPEIGQRLAQGVPLLAVVCEAHPAPVSGPPPKPVRPSIRTPRAVAGRPQRLAARPVVVMGVLLAGGAALAALLWRGSPRPPPAVPGVPAAQPAGGPGGAAGGAAGVAPASGAAPATAVRPSTADRGDSLFYSVQVAAFSRAEQAAAYAERLARRAGAATVSPVRLGRQGLWFRVMVGALSTAAGADSLLRELWRSKLVERGSGTILRTPHAYLVARPAGREATAAVLEGVRRQGMAGYIVAAPGGEVQVLVGAFEDPEQARVADSLLRLAGLEAKLVSRMGKTP